MQKQVDDVYVIFENKLAHDVSSFRLYISRLSEEDERNRSALRNERLQLRQTADLAAKSCISKRCSFCLQPSDDTPQLQKHVTEALQLLAENNRTAETSTLVILDASCVESSSWSDKVAQAALILNRQPLKNALCVLYPWSRDKNTGMEIRSARAGLALRLHLIRLLRIFTGELARERPPVP